MRAGDLRHRIDVIEKQITTDPNTGIQSETWHYKFQSVPASFRSLTSRELMAAAQRQSEMTSEFEIRYGLDIKPEDKIVFNDQLWDIEPPRHDETLRIFDKIRAVAKSSLQSIVIESG